jgi:hypothetical protein
MENGTTSGSSDNNPTVINQPPDNSAYSIFATRDEVKELKKDLRREIAQPWWFIGGVIAFVSIGGIWGAFKWTLDRYREWNRNEIQNVLKQALPTTSPDIQNSPTPKQK